MASEMKTYYFFRRGGQTLCVELLHYVNNTYAAEKAMLNTYGLSKSDLIHTGSQPNAVGYSTFDGRNFH